MDRLSKVQLPNAGPLGLLTDENPFSLRTGADAQVRPPPKGLEQKELVFPDPAVPDGLIEPPEGFVAAEDCCRIVDCDDHSFAGILSRCAIAWMMRKIRLVRNQPVDLFRFARVPALPAPHPRRPAATLKVSFPFIALIVHLFSTVSCVGGGVRRYAGYRRLATSRVSGVAWKARRAFPRVALKHDRARAVAEDHAGGAVLPVGGLGKRASAPPGRMFV